MRLIVKAKKLNIRKRIPIFFPDPDGITGVVAADTIFEGEEVLSVPNPALGKWYRDRDGYFYWGGGLGEIEEPVDDQDPEVSQPDNIALDRFEITPRIKKKIEQVINAFETSSAHGNYAVLVKLADHTDSATRQRIVQITYGRSQTTEFSHLKELVEDYIEQEGLYSSVLKSYLPRIGKKPSLATDEIFCKALKDAGKSDPVMKLCQDALFESKYYQPAHRWFANNGFTLPLSLLVIYDSFIHSGGILGFLRKRFSESVPANGGNEKEWIRQYVNTRHEWLANHSIELLRHTTYRTKCFKEQLAAENWDLSKKLKANGVSIE
jgi:chitosanase